MNTKTPTVEPIIQAIHIHPALSEVSQRAAGSLMTVEDYAEFIRDGMGVLL